MTAAGQVDSGFNVWQEVGPVRVMRVLVCGANYGRAYLEAVGGGGAYQAVGLLARGSQRAEALARQYDLPLYRHPEQLPDDIDIACAAMGTAAHHVVLALVDRGIHVLCEHPQRPHDLAAAVAAAQARGVRFHVNGHFADLPAARAFAGEIGRWSSEGPPCSIDVFTTDRALYASADILARAGASLEPTRVDACSTSGAFRIITGALGSASATFQIQTRDAGGERLPDGDPGYLIDCRIAVAFRSAVVTLMSIAGPVLTQMNDPFGRQPLWRPVYAPLLTRSDLYDQRAKANIEALDTLRADIHDCDPPRWQRPEHLLRVSRVWEQLGACLTD